MGLYKVGTALIASCIAPVAVHASTAESIIRQVSMRTGWLKLAMLVGWLVCARLVTKGPSLARKLLFGLVLGTFVVSQGLSIIETYRNTTLYQPRKTMTLSDLQIIANLYNAREFSGRNALPLLVADYMPQAKVFLYDENVYSETLLAWSGRNPASTFVIGGYDPTMDASFKTTCLRRPHVIYTGRSKAPLYVATPLSLYEQEKEVYLLKDGLIDYLIPGSWRNVRDE